ncbi:cytochrome b5 [Apis cerana]|uniref:cytochrome b5 n=1 Tax=Apis cerana TaxID=7461 RepID=UPI002B22E9FB|nr:cytochrome b5 [Apis cerana]
MPSRLLSNRISPRIEEPSKTMSKQFTRSEVAKLSNKDKTLIILHDKVYDVTSFLNEHPGGEEVLLDHSGIDGSEDFDDVGHSTDAFDLMTKYQVGELIESEKTGNLPKKTWTKDNFKSNKTNQGENQGMPTTMVVSILAVLAAIVYFVYL